MDSLIHYRADDIARAVAGLAGRCDRAVLATFAPRTALLTLMHAAGKLFPRSDRSPAIQPVTERGLRRRIDALPGCRTARTHRVAGGFYISQALEVVTDAAGCSGPDPEPPSPLATDGQGGPGSSPGQPERSAPHLRGAG